MSTRCKGLGALLPVAPFLRHLSVSPVLAISCAAVLLSPSWSRAIGVHCACEATALTAYPWNRELVELPVLAIYERCTTASRDTSTPSAARSSASPT